MSKTSSAVATGAVERSEDATPEPTGPLAATSSTTPKEGLAVSGSMPTIIPYMYMHWIFYTAFSWSSDQKPGTILWSTPLSPLFMNYVIRYFSLIHNIWQGSFDFELWMAGTGFNGGKLVFFWCPPNYNLEDFTLEEATTFAHVEIDPKMNTPIPIKGKDFCLQKAHVVRNSNKDPDLKNPDFISEYARIGGYLGIMVMNPLINASESKTAVNISMMNKAGEDFRLFQIVPPPKELAPALSLPDYHFHNEHVSYSTQIAITHMHVSTKNATVSVDVGLLRDTHTKKYARNPDMERMRDIFSPCRIQEKWEISSGITELKGPNPHNLRLIANDIQAVNQTPSLAGQATNVYSGTSSPTDTNWRQVINVGNDGDTSIVFAINSVTQIAPYTGNLLVFKNWTYATGFDVQPWTITCLQGENIVTFANQFYTDGCGAAVTNGLDIFNKYLTFHTSRNPVFEVVDKKTKLNLFYIRWNSEGFFSANKVDNIVAVELEDVFLKFAFYLYPNAPLPVVTPTNLLQYELQRKMKRLDHLEERMHIFLQLEDLHAENEYHDGPSSESEGDHE